LHIAQRGDYIPQSWLKDNWLEIIKDDYPHFKTVNTRIERLEACEDRSKALYSYMTKYMVKTWEIDSQKGWTKVQALHPGLRHYRHTQGWRLIPEPASSGKWELHLEPAPRAIAGEYVPVSKYDMLVAAHRKLLRTEVDVNGFSPRALAWVPTAPLTETRPEDWEWVDEAGLRPNQPIIVCL
jgi:hypothetical protein